MGLKAQREAALKAARDIAERVKAEGRSFTDDERTEVDTQLAKADELEQRIKAASDDEALLKRLDSISPAEREDDGDEPKAKSLGEHFVKHVGAEGLTRVKSTSGLSVGAPEFKAAHTIGDVFSSVVTDQDRTVVREYRRPTVSDLFGTGTLSGNAVTYLVENPDVTGGFETVAETGQKPEIGFGDPTPRTDALKKIAAWWDMSDEMIEDVPFWVSEINNRGLYLLSLAEEAQLLTGSGTGSNIEGVLNRDGIQSLGLDGGSEADALFRALTAVQTATGLSADGIVINPADYQALRLAKDGNDQYYGGGFFAGQYGNGGFAEQPPLWGTRTVVTAAVPAGTAVVGAFKAATTVYRKGGVRVESTNSDQGKFTTNVVTTRIEERIALAVRMPAAIVNVDLSAGVGGE